MVGREGGGGGRGGEGGGDRFEGGRGEGGMKGGIYHTYMYKFVRTYSECKWNEVYMCMYINMNILYL